MAKLADRTTQLGQFATTRLANHLAPRLQDWFVQRCNQPSASWFIPNQIAKTAEQTLALSVACLHTSIVLVDDMLDQEPDGIHHQFGAATVANWALMLQAAGAALLLSANLPPNQQLAALTHYHNSAAGTAIGQALDVAGIQSEADYWRIAEQKSGVYFGTLFALGGLFGDGSADLLYEIGRQYGIMVQISDDLKDCLTESADWLTGRTPLPILYAMQVAHPDQAQFQQLQQSLQHAPDQSKLATARTILVRSGAISYAIHCLQTRQQKVAPLLAKLPNSQRTSVTTLFARIEQPLNALLHSIV